MTVAILRTRLRPEAEATYKEMSRQIVPLARSIDGYVAHKTYVAQDGERVTIVEYESKDTMLSWARHPDHVRAKRAGIKEFFSEYRVQVCEVIR